MRLFCLLIAASCGSLFAAETSPGQAAIAYLEQVRLGKINLDPGKATAISPHILDWKRDSIAGRLQRLGNQLGQGKLELGRERIEGDLAGVLIWKADGFDPSQMQVIPVGMVKRDGKWLPAPVPASFENCGISYRAETRKNIKELESWMLQGKVEDLSKLREKSIARMRADIQKHLTREQLAKMKPREVMDRFLAACGRRNAHEIMGLVGGLSKALPDNWAVRANSIETATADLKAPGPWRLLMSPNVLRATVDWDEEGGPLHASIACLDPQVIATSNKREPRVVLVHLKLEKGSDGLWEVVVPRYFWQDQSIPSNNSHDELDRDLLGRFAQEVRKQYPAQAHDTQESCRKALVQALQNSQFSDLLKITNIPDNPILGRKAILDAAEAWGSLHSLADESNPASAHMILDLDMKVIGNEAGILVHTFSARKPDRYDPRALFLVKTKGGWLWSPNPNNETLDAFKVWSDEATKAQRDGWRMKLLENCPVVEKLEGPAPSEEEAKALVERWITAIESGDVLAGLELCARLDQEDSSKVMLRNLGYEVVDALRKEGKGSIKHVLTKGPWTGVGTHPRNPQTRSFSMYPVVKTAKGPRILLEIDLIASSGRGREFLNRTSLGRASKLGNDASKPLSELFEEHCRKCLPKR